MEGNTGLFIDRELTNGETHRCTTFDNEPLIPTGYEFSIFAIEIYAFFPADED